MGKAALRVQVDVGIGDATVPEPVWLDYPSLLDLPRPRIRAYAVETVVAEKLHAIVMLGSRNSRMKDYFDLNAIARERLAGADQLGESIAATFKRRRTPVPDSLPVGLSDDFWLDPLKQSQWKAFLGKNGLVAPPLMRSSPISGTLLRYRLNPRENVDDDSMDAGGSALQERMSRVVRQSDVCRHF